MTHRGLAVGVVDIVREFVAYHRGFSTTTSVLRLSHASHTSYWEPLAPRHPPTMHDNDYTIVVQLMISQTRVKTTTVFVIMNDYKMEAPSPSLGW
jgi:hypothetical protein